MLLVVNVRSGMSTTSSVTLMSGMDTLFNAIGMEVVLLVFFVMGYLSFNSSSIQKRLGGFRDGEGAALLEKQTAAHLASGQYR